MGRYLLCGLVVESSIDLKLPRTLRSVRRPNLRFTVVKSAMFQDELLAEAKLIEERKTTKGASIYQLFRRGSVFLLHHYVGDIYSFDPQLGHLECHAHPNSHPSHWRDILLSWGLAFTLHQRGVPLLHASVVRYQETAIAFCGDSGMGKSTICGLFLARGHGFLSDDVAPVELVGETAYVIPSFPVLKIYPEVAASLGMPVETMERVSPNSLKVRCLVGENIGDFCDEAVPLRAIYILERRGSGEIRPIAGRDAIVQLLKHTFMSSLIPDSRQLPGLTANLADLVPEVPVCQLDVPDIRQLGHLYARIIEDVDSRRSPVS